MEQQASSGIGGRPSARQIAGRGEVVGDFEATLAESKDRAIDGARFALDGPERIPAVWGDGEAVAWSEGEPLLIAGSPGVGKTTLAERLALLRAGVRSGELLGMPVEPDDGRILYVAADRPAQARRSFRRMVGEADREALSTAIVVWTGPLDFDLGRCEPGQLAETVRGFPEVGTVVLDSLGSLAVGLADDEVGARVSRELQTLVAGGVQVAALHHQRKASGDNRQPRALDDVYGSRWLTSGAGSVILLWGQAGDPIVDLRHLKQPAGEVGPFTVAIDHERGGLALHEARTVAEIVAGATNGGTTAREVAVELFGTAKPSRAEVEKARRRLASCAAAVHVEGSSPALWRPLERRLP